MTYRPHLNNKNNTEEDLHEIVYDECVFQLEGFSIFHVLWSGVEAEVEIADENEHQRSRRVAQKPWLCAGIWKCWRGENCDSCCRGAAQYWPSFTTKKLTTRSTKLALSISCVAVVAILWVCDLREHVLTNVNCFSVENYCRNSPSAAPPTARGKKNLFQYKSILWEKVYIIRDEMCIVITMMACISSIGSDFQEHQ